MSRKTQALYTAVFAKVKELVPDIKACVSRFDSGAYDTLQFLRAVSHALGAHTVALLPSTPTVPTTTTTTSSRHRLLPARRPQRRCQERQLLQTQTVL